MASIKPTRFTAIIIAISSLVFGATCFAANDPSPDTDTLTAEQRRIAISQNCVYIRESLQQLQHVDSRTRTYLGTAYESISSRFITPLNLRLIKLGKPSSSLLDIQSGFTAAQSVFRERYVDYMRSLEALIATDCTAHPDEFYDNLQVTRQKREALRLSTRDLSKLAEEQYQAVTELKETL